MILKSDIKKALIAKFNHLDTINRTGNPFSSIIHNCQYKFIFRQLYLENKNSESKSLNVIKKLAHKKVDLRFYEDIRYVGRSALESIIIHQFYNKGYLNWWYIIFRFPTIVTDNFVELGYNFPILIDLLFGAIGPRRMNSEWRSSDVMALIKVMRRTEDFSLMPKLSDALQDAGCNDKFLMKRLQTDKYFSLGDWVFKATGMIG